MTLWMINCKEHASLVSQKLDRPLSFRDKVMLRLHQLVCPPCKHIQTQMVSIRKACRWVPPNEMAPEEGVCVLPEEARMRINAALKDCIHQAVRHSL
jgi:hypothetical protein